MSTVSVEESDASTVAESDDEVTAAVELSCPGRIRNEAVDTDEDTDGPESLPPTPVLPVNSTEGLPVISTEGLRHRADVDTPRKHQTASDADISLRFRQLNKKLMDAGMYEMDSAFYYREVVKTFMLFAATLFFAYRCNGHPLAVIASAVCTAVMWWQGSFVCHDCTCFQMWLIPLVGHNGVTHNRRTDSLLGIFFADLIGGLSIGWWKKSHYTHHQETNDPENDPDIQHLPFFAVTTKFVDSIFSTYHQKVLKFDAFARATVPFQHYYYYLLLSFGRFNLYIQSYLYLLNFRDKVHYRQWEILAQLGFASWYIPLIMQLPSWKLRLVYILISNLATGILHVQITLSHFAMSTEQVPNENWAVRALRLVCLLIAYHF